RSLLTSRWIVTRRMPTPNRTSVHGTTGRGRVPVGATGASAAIIVNATASTKQRAPMRIATAALARTAELRGMKHVEDDAARAKMRGHGAVRGRDADAQDPVVRTTEREHRAREAGGDLRRDDDERRTPGQTAARAEGERLRGASGVGPGRRGGREG